MIFVLKNKRPYQPASITGTYKLNDVMKANLDIIGIYQFEGRKLKSQNKPFYLIQDERKTNNSNKPPVFLVAKTTGQPFPETGKKDQYISSVYTVPDQPFSRIEYNGKQYGYKVVNDGAIIQPFGQMATYINSHLEL
jgi:hypothetical protein